MLATRLPGYQPSEYLREVNVAYADTWDYILQLDDSYFTDVKTAVVNVAAAEFDFLFNTNGNLATPISNRYFQIDRIRVLQPGQSNWFAAQPRPWNDTQFQMLQQLTPQAPAQNAPYLYVLLSRGSVLFSQPLPVGTTIEVVYTFTFLPLRYVTAGTVVITNGNTVNGAGSTFTQVIGPDYVANSLPNIDQDTDIGLEFILGGSPFSVPVAEDTLIPLTYRCLSVQNDTLARTAVAINGTPTNYVLAMVPDIPYGHHRVISTIATRNIMSTPGNDSRFAQWAAMAQQQTDLMRDTVMTRQRQQPARRQRFTQSLLRYQLAPPGR